MFGHLYLCRGNPQPETLTIDGNSTQQSSVDSDIIKWQAERFRLWGASLQPDNSQRKASNMTPLFGKWMSVKSQMKTTSEEDLSTSRTVLKHHG